MATATRHRGNTRPGAICNFAMEKSKGFCFTINNPTEVDDGELQNLKDTASVVYLVWGTEIGEEGTLHYQGFVRFKHATSFQRLKRLLSRAHIEKQLGTSQQAAEYCKKDGIFQEHGELPASAGSKTKEM